MSESSINHIELPPTLAQQCDENVKRVREPGVLSTAGVLSSRGRGRLGVAPRTARLCLGDASAQPMSASTCRPEGRAR